MQLEFFLKFPSMERESLRDLKKGIDLTFKDFSREYGDSIEGFFGPLLKFLVWFEKFLITTPWPLIIFLLSFLAWLSSRSLKLSIGTAISFFVIGYFGMWKDTMSTMAIISVATLICLIIGTPIGVLMARSERLKNILSPVLDMMQTIPTFVYLIPIIMLLGIGKVPGLLAVCVYAIPPIVRLTNLGIREVDRRVVEAAKALGIKKRIILFKIEIPLALPSIMTGVNQTIMMALAMVVIASMIGVSGLGVPILRSISNQFLALGLMNGLAIVALAIIFDRISQNYARRIQKHKEEKMTFFTGYDCDSLAMEPITNFINDFVPFFSRYKKALFEIRTKSINNTVFRKHDPLENCIIAYSLMPEALAQTLDKKAPSVSARIKNIKYLANKGWRIGLRFDPLIYCSNWKAQYAELFANIFKEIKEENIHSVSFGSLRFPKSFFNKLLQYYPTSEELSFLRSNDKGIISYDQSIENEMNEYCRSELMKYSDARKFFSCG